MWAEVKRYWVSNAGASFVAQGLDDGGTNRSQLGGIGLSLNVYHNCGGVLVSFGATLPLLANTVCRLAMAVATGAISFASRGTTDTGGATTVLPTAVTRLYICNAAVSRTALDGVTRELRFWKANKITNSELQRITT
jgi:hypothetical protein